MRPAAPDHVITSASAQAPGITLAADEIGDRGGQQVITFTVPIATHSKLNQRVHWAVRAKQAKRERLAVWAAAPAVWRVGWNPADRHLQPSLLPCTVTLTRLSPRELDDDNLRGALKCVRDQVAAMLGVDDRDARVRWEYGQAKGKAAVRVDVAPLTDWKQAIPW